MRAFLLFISTALAQPMMIDPSKMSGIPRPDPQVPEGTITVRLIRGELSNRVVNHPVELGGAEPHASACRGCGTPLPSQQFLTDLTGTLSDLNQRYDLGPERGLLQEYCPTCKRKLRGQAYFQVMGKRFL